MAVDHERRVVALTMALAGVSSNAEAAMELGLSVRQVRRLKAALARQGPAGLVHGNRGRRPAHRLSDELRARLVELATTRYADHNHVQLCEVLREREQLVVTHSTLRRVLFSAGVRSPRTRRVRLAPGMMPVAFDLVNRRVEMLDLPGADYREPSFHQTVELRRGRPPPPLNFDLDLETFLRVASLEPGRRPDGFLFDAGRCGSTLLGNMLSVPEQHLVIKESPAVNGLMAGLLNANDEATRRQRADLLEASLPFMFRPTRGVEERLVFKLSSWNVCLADTLLRLFPTTPAAFLYRSPSPVVASMLGKPPAWQSLLDRPRTTQARLFPSLATLPQDAPLSATALYAHAWRSAAEAALAQPPERLLLVEYNEMIATPEAMLRRLLAHFGLEVAPETLSLMCEQASSSRNPRSGLAAESSTEPEVRVLEPTLEAEVVSIVGNLPRLLAARHGRA